MAQPQQSPYTASRPYASPHATPSPVPGSNSAFAVPTPIKRPAANSPTSPASPYPPLHSPPISNGVNSFQTNPYHSQGSNPYPIPTNHATSPVVRQTPPLPSSQSQSQPQTQSQMGSQPPSTAAVVTAASSQPQQQQPSVMGPPPNKPDDDKPMDLNDIQDVMTGSGVDLKAEEAAMSFGGLRTGPAQGGPPQGYFDSPRNTLQTNTPGGRDSFYGSGPFNQPATATTPRDLEDELVAREKLAIRRRNERDQYHSNNPFLQNRIVMQRIDAAGKKNQTMISLEGVFHPQRPITTRLIITGPEGQDRMATLTKEPLATTTAPIVDVLTLLSLACRERLRNVLEDSASMARSRRLTAHGVIPPDLQDIAVGAGKSEAATGVPTPRIVEDTPGPPSRKRSHSQIAESATPAPEPQAESEERPEPVPTVAYPDLVVEALQRQATAEAAYEREREAKRQKRTTASLISSSEATSRAGSLPGTPGASTPGPVDAAAPEGRLTKKEQKRREDERVALSAAKDTKNAVNMALGGSKKYSWMSGGSKAGGGLGLGTSFGKRPAGTPAKKAAEPKADGTPAAAAASTTAATTTAGAATAPAAPTGATIRGGRVLGSFREDREDGRGIQMRDLLPILLEGHEKRTLSKSYGRLK